MKPTEDETRAWMVAWLQNRDETAGRKLIDAYYPFVFGLIRKHVAEFDMVQELVQQTFTRCFSRAEQWDPRRPLEPWLAKIAVNLCRDHFRSLRRRGEIKWSDLTPGQQMAYDSTTDPTPSAASSLDEDARTLLLRMFEILGPDDRMVLSLLYLEQQSVDQIARTTGWSKTVIKVRVFRAKRKLRSGFQRLEERK